MGLKKEGEDKCKISASNVSSLDKCAFAPVEVQEMQKQYGIKINR